jgi:hypothetical protein
LDDISVLLLRRVKRRENQIILVLSRCAGTIARRVRRFER